MKTSFAPITCNRMISFPSRLAALLGIAWGIVCGILPVQAQIYQTYSPANWVDDPFSPNANYTLTSANTSSPTYQNNGTGLGNLNGYSPIGATITLATGDTVFLTGQVTITGPGVDPGNNQFRMGLYYQGTNPTDTGWAGYMLGSPRNETSTSWGVYMRNIPNTGQFGSGTGTTVGAPGSLVRAGTFNNAATYHLTLSVTYLSSSSTLIRFTLQGVSPSTYLYSGRFTNNSATTQGGFSFDHVGFLGGATLFASASPDYGIQFANVQVSLGKFGDSTWTNDASGLWSATGNWTNGVVANGSGFIADFSQVNLTADRTVTLDANRTVGGMGFGATSGSTYNWFLVSSGGSILTLDIGAPSAPSIAVSQNTATLGLSLVSPNGLTKTGAGTLVLGGANTIVGPLNLNGGAINFPSLANLPLAAGISAINFGGGALQWAPGNTLDISSLGVPISFAGNAGFDTSANNVTLATGFGDGGAGGLTKLGAGTLTLNGTVSYTGATTVSNGVLALGSSGSISSSTNISVRSGATLDVSALAGGLTLSQNLSGAGTVLGNVTDAAGVTIAPGTAGAGTLTANGNLSLNGGGALNYELSDVTTAGSGVNDLIVVTGNLNIAGLTTFNVSLINGAPGSGTYTLFTYNTFSGSLANLTAPIGFTVVNNATAKTIELVAAHVPASLTWKGDNSVNAWDTDTTANWLQSGTNQYFFTGDSVTFDDTGFNSPAINISGSVSPASVTVNASQNYDFAGTGAMITGQLTKTGTGTLILENNNTYTGPTVIGGGTLQVGGDVNGGATGALGTGPVTNNSALVFYLATDSSVTTNIYGTGSITNIGSAGTVTLSGSISGSTMNMAGFGVMVLSGSNSYTGQTIISSGSLQANNSFALGSGTAGTVVSNGAQLYINANINISGESLSLAGTGPATDGALRKGGGGVTALSGVITLTGDTQFQVDGGGSTLNLTNAAGINAPGINVTLSGGAGTITGPLNLGSGSLTKADAGTWTIAPTNTYTGLTVINGGMLQIAAAAALGPVSTFTPAYVNLNGGSLGVTTNVTFNDGFGGFTIGTSGGFDVPAGMTLVISNQIDGAGTINKTGGGTLVLSGSNTFSGTLNVDSGAAVGDAGFVRVASSNAIANVVSPIAIRNNSGGTSTLELDGSSGSIVVTQDITLRGRSPAIPAIINVAGTNTLAGNLTGGDGGSQYRIQSDSGLLTLGSSGTSLTFTTTDLQTLTFQGNGSFSVAGVISDGSAATSVKKDGNGSMTLGAVNTYSGSTIVTGGALDVNGTIGSGTVTISGGILGGTGIINGQVNVGSGGTFSPGAPLGTLTINSNLTLAGNTFVEVNKTTGARDQVAGLTGLTYGGTLTVSNVSGTLAPSDSFQIFPATTFTGNFTGISPALGGGLSWSFNPTNGVLSVVSGIPSTPTNITFSVSGNTLSLNWPASYIGWILQTQTNSLNVGISTNWTDVPGSASMTSTYITNNPANPTVFYRLRYP
jgi:autotransporter-associated beta strand protein